MVMENLPRQRVLDHLTRVDELIIKQMELMRELGGLIDINIQGVPGSKTLDKVALKKKVESGQWVPYSIKTISLTTARTDEPILVEGDFVHAWTDGELEGIGIRLGHVKNDLLYFKRRNPVSGFRFWAIFLTNTAQAGKTLDLMIGREASAQAQTTEVTVSTAQKFYSLRSDKDTHFTGAIAQNAKEDENLAGLLTNKIRIVGISLQSDQNLSYRVILWKTDGFEDVDLDLDTFCAEVVIDLPVNGYQIGGAVQYYLDMRGLDIDYEDEDASLELHVSLMCLTAEGKDAIASAALAGAQADDGGVQTDEAAEANSAAANDMTLLPAVPVVNDAYYFGANGPFNQLTVNIGTQGDGTWTIVWEYYNGSAWVALAGVTDGTLAFEAAVGNRDVDFTRPADWARVAVNGVTAFWIRARVSVFNAVVTQPLGTQAWVSGSGEVALELYYEPRA